jgi:hypothetical protein
MNRIAKITVRLNGTDKNPFAIWGMRCNPFPQVGEYELMPVQRRLAELAGEPIKDEADLRKRLEGFDANFVEGCVRRFRPGEIVEFDIEFPY